jgi:hypothetical protein
MARRQWLLVDHPNVRRFITTVRQAHASAFALHSETAILLEEAMVTPHAHRDELGLTLDMLFVQGHKAHLSVMRLAELALVEDGATITRRLMELGIQAAYITNPPDDQGKHRRAGKYLAFMWRQFPRRFRETFPPHLKAQWSQFARSYGRFVSAKAKTWGPNWKDMFEETGNLRTYTSDYAFLSAIAHGRPDEQILAFSGPTIRVTPHHHVSGLLIYASRYYLGLGMLWSSFHNLLPEPAVEALSRKLRAWRPS